ncbi:hypothetical protein ACFOOK_27995 [Micromonospora krabiensis]|uniref:Uncharacterized protein n=1 Tax=Micromonospora krabiensis TaxID=307121 RepID=A0A1C3N4T9_9ACTN|nr:hypothetical protein [Micromonospora krabiensis]SBV27588.1 hypothetical protein GA0070620_3112 [Micromonospora krabiensis]
MKTPKQRATALNVRGNIALATAGAVGAFLTAARAARGPWLPMHTWLVAVIATAAATALACYLLAWLKGSPRGDSPQVTHPPVTPSRNAYEVRK